VLNVGYWIENCEHCELNIHLLGTYFRNYTSTIDFLQLCTAWLSMPCSAIGIWITPGSTGQHWFATSSAVVVVDLVQYMIKFA
jgi:hypothetical protein